MEIILKEKLSKYMIKIIDECLNQSFENIVKILSETNQIKYRIRTDITIKDIFVMCVQLGVSGFFLNGKTQTCLIKIIKQLIKNETTDISINQYIKEDNYFFHINSKITNKNGR